MGCDVFLIRQKFTSHEGEKCIDLVEHEVFWDVKSWQIGELFANHYLIVNQWQPVCITEFAEFCKCLIEDGKDDYGEYPDGALKAVVEDLEELDEGIRFKSNWFVTLDF
jgi:hypothetical protein